MTTHEVISAFLDDEPFDPHEFATALSDPAGRALLIDLVVLRRIIQPTDAIPAMPMHRSRAWLSLRSAAAAALIFVALAGAYVIGTRRAPDPIDEAPAPTRIVQASPEWPASKGELR
jgi:hypothetical protein